MKSSRTLYLKKELVSRSKHPGLYMNAEEGEQGKDMIERFLYAQVYLTHI